MEDLIIYNKKSLTLRSPKRRSIFNFFARYHKCTNLFCGEGGLYFYSFKHFTNNYLSGIRFILVLYMSMTSSSTQETLTAAGGGALLHVC